MGESYQNERDQKAIEQTRALLRELPPFCGVFLRGIESTTSALTRRAYASDLNTFFRFLCTETAEFADQNPRDFKLSSLECVQSEQIEEYLSYLGYYVDDQTLHVQQNRDKAKARKLSSLRALYKYFCKKKKLKANVAALVDPPKLHDKAIVRLETDEAAKLIDGVEGGHGLSKQQKRYHSKTQWRDAAILAMFLGTGIRVSELVGLNLSDIDAETQAFRVTRKGGAEVQLYYGDEVAEALHAFLQHRALETALDGHEDALFLSMQQRRITTRAVQNLVKKYADAAVPLKRISPHKLRSTFGTMLYEETGDIYLVADVLGHSDVNTTRKHYAAQSDQNRRRAARAIKLRDE